MPPRAAVRIGGLDLRTTPTLDCCGGCTEQLVGRGRVTELAEAREQAHDLQIGGKLAAHEDTIDLRHDRKGDRDQPLVGSGDPAVNAECLTKRKLLGATHVEVAVCGSRRREAARDLGGKVLGAHRV
jgi:hypothetical protein